MMAAWARCRDRFFIKIPPETEKIISSDIEWMRSDERELIRELYIKMKNKGLRPKTIVDYTREPFIFAPGNVRVTLDYNIQSFCTQMAEKAYLQKEADSVSILVMNPQNGELLAMVDYPEFNSNDPFTLITQYSQFSGTEEENNYGLVDSDEEALQLIKEYWDDVFGYFLDSITPDMFNDLKIKGGLFWGKVYIDTLNELVALSNISNAALPEIETQLSNYMMEMGKEKKVDQK